MRFHPHISFSEIDLQLFAASEIDLHVYNFVQMGSEIDLQHFANENLPQISFSEIDLQRFAAFDSTPPFIK